MAAAAAAWSAAGFPAWRCCASATVVFSSPMSRCLRKLARELADQREPIVCATILVELAGFGAWEGKSWECGAALMN